MFYFSSNIAPESARKTFINANSLDIDCAVVCVYYAQFEYRHNKDNARTIIVKGKCDGRTPKILLTQAYRNIKNNIANLFDGIADPWDEALCDVTDTGTFTTSKAVSPEKPGKLFDLELLSCCFLNKVYFYKHLLSQIFEFNH